MRMDISSGGKSYCSHSKSDVFINFQLPCWCPLKGHQQGVSILRALYKFAWNFWANNLRTVYRTDLRLGGDIC